MSRPKTFDREQVLDRAMHVFWTKGYECTSVQDLVDAMGINRGSIYATFGDKHALPLAALERFTAREIIPLLSPLEEPGPVRVALRLVFMGMIERTVLGQGPRGWMVSNAAVELCPGDGEVNVVVAAALREIESRLYVALVRAQESGELAPRRDLQALARYFTNSLNGLSVIAKAVNDPHALGDIVDVTLAALDRRCSPNSHSVGAISRH